MKSDIEQEAIFTNLDGRSYVRFADYEIPNLDYLGRLHYASAHSPLQEHRHPEAFEICYLDRGTQTYVVGGSEYRLVGGDLFITHPEEPHGTGERPEEKSVLYWLIFSDTVGREGFLGLGPEGEYLLEDIRSIRRRVFPAAGGIREHLDALFAIDRENGYLKRQRILHHVVEFLMLVVQSARRSGRDRPSRARRELSGPIAVAVDYIHSHIEENVALETLADVTGLSLSHFKRRFRNETGVPPRELALRAKVDRAGSLLRNDRLSVTETAITLGFSSSQYFATVYRRYTGHSPSDDRAYQ